MSGLLWRGVLSLLHVPRAAQEAQEVLAML